MQSSLCVAHLPRDLILLLCAKGSRPQQEPLQAGVMAPKEPERHGQQQSDPWNLCQISIVFQFILLAYCQVLPFQHLQSLSYAAELQKVHVRALMGGK
eukprot:scaffold175136_cov14-Tisochrysis_lutea.AAC.1